MARTRNSRMLGAGAPGSVGGSCTVTLKAGPEGIKAPPEAGRDLADTYGAEIRHTYGTALNGYAVRADAARARRLAAGPKAASVVQDTRVSLDHTRKNPAWGLDRIDQPALSLDTSYSWPESSGGGVKVYVVDTRVRRSHKDFGGRASSGWDFADNDATAQDGNGHGTHAAGTVADKEYGVAKKAGVAGVRVLDDQGAGTTAQVIAGIDRVTRNARKPAVADLSLGGYANARPDAAVRGSIASGLTYPVAAGNDGLPASLYSPARDKEAVTVGASDTGDARASFSNWGTRLDLFAPGVGIASAWNTGDTATGTLSGTSMASPHAAGAAALRLAGHASATPAQVGKALAGKAVRSEITGAGPGSPNRLLQVDD